MSERVRRGKKETEREKEAKRRGGQVCAISPGTVCAVPDGGDMAAAGINKRSAVPEHHDQAGAQLKSFLSSLGERP